MCPFGPMLEGRDDVIGIGVSTPGPVDVKLGKIINPGYFHGIKNVSVTEPLREKYGIRFFWIMMFRVWP